MHLRYLTCVLTLEIAVCGVATVEAQVRQAVQSAEGAVCTVELSSGVRFEACVTEVNEDTVYFETFAGGKLRLPSEMVIHGILDVPSQGTWRPRTDQRRSWSLRVLLDLNVARAEYGSSELRGGTQMKLAAVRRCGQRFSAGPGVGIAAMRAGYHETVVPVFASFGYELTPRISLVNDVGYGLGLISHTDVTAAGGGLHMHPRVTVKGAHPYNQFNIEFGFGYVYQQASFSRYQESRFLAEGLLRPGIPGNVKLDIPYHRFSLSFMCTFW